MKKKLGITSCVLGLIFSGCGGESSSLPGISFSQNKGEAGYLQLNITDAKGKSLGQKTEIETYKAVVEGEGLQSKEEILPVGLSGVVIDGIPAGKNRKISIQALNIFGEVVREGIAEGVSIEKGKRIALDIALQSVPLSLNLKAEDFLSNQRLYFHLFSDPGHVLSVRKEDLLQDVVGGKAFVVANSKGEAKFYPGPLPAGDYHFTLIDQTNRRARTVTIHLWDGTKVKAAPFFTASTSASRLGQGIARRSHFNGNGGEFFPNVREALWNAR